MYVYVTASTYRCLCVIHQVAVGDSNHTDMYKCQSPNGYLECIVAVHKD